MNVWLTRAALRVRGLSSGAFRVLVAHTDACPPSGRTCLPGLEELAAACELSPKHVMRLRAQLVVAGHLRKVVAAQPGQCPVYEVLRYVSVPQRSSPPRAEAPGSGGRDLLSRSTADEDRGQNDQPGASTDAVALAAAAIAALRPDQRARIDELGRHRLERAAQPLVDGWSPADLGRRIEAKRLDRAENLAAVLTAVLRRFALEPTPRELRAAERRARQARAHEPPPIPCAHGDPGGCAACSFCRRRLADPGGERCGRCGPSLQCRRW